MKKKKKEKRRLLTSKKKGSASSDEEDGGEFVEKKSSPLLRRLTQMMGSRSKISHPPSPGRQRPHTSHTVRTAKELGKGHEFELKQLVHPTWCDFCDDFLWGLFKQSVQCKKCKYTCHEPCRYQVTLDCAGVMAKKSLEKEDAADKIIQNASNKSDQNSDGQTPISSRGLLTFLQADDIRKKIEEYNEKTTGLHLELLPDSADSANHGKLFKGSIRVAMNLSRPIRVASEDECFNFMQEDRSTTPTHRSRSGSGKHAVGESFFLPKNVSKGLFLTSTTTAQEVISVLLKKFNVVSNPRKFSLYEKNIKDGTQRRLRRYEEPLVLVLYWGADNQDLTLSLQENEADTEFHWEEFTVAELETFMKILDKEENEHINQVRKRYAAKAARLQAAITECTNQVEQTKDVEDHYIKEKCEQLERQDVDNDALAAIDDLSRTDADLAIDELGAD
eukprot:m.94412 g.94412  ORF g.94412 m.94412 type:complete len:447 (-) comp21857_c0_seq3:64-1404(-)